MILKQKNKIETIHLAKLKVSEIYRIFQKKNLQLIADFKFFYSPLPAIIVNTQNEIVFGIEMYLDLIEGGIKNEKIEVLKIDIDTKSALYLAFNMSGMFFEINLHDRLNFVKKILQFSKISEIYKLSKKLNLKLNQQLIENIETLAGKEFKAVLTCQNIELLTALKICDFSNDDKKTLIRFFLHNRYSKSNQLKFIEILEDLIFRDKCSIKMIFEKSGINGLIGEKNNSILILKMLNCFRFPQLTKREVLWKSELSHLAIPENLKISHSENFEKKKINVQLEIKDFSELKKTLKKLNSIKYKS